MTKTKIDLLKIDLEAGKPWGQIVRDDELRKRQRSIRTTHRDKHTKDRKDKNKEQE
jgi:hypothetical protein